MWLDAMILNKLSVINYKNIGHADLEFSHKFNCFLGANGEGKTNLLDAIYYMSFCRSAGNPIDSQVIKHDEEFFMIQGIFSDREGETVDVYCGVKRRQKKQFKLNGVLYKRVSEHIGTIPVVLISPADQMLISGGSEERRFFLDSVISQFDSEYLNCVIRHNNALQQRNAFLKTEAPDLGMIEIYEEVMAAEGEKIYAKRRDFVESFKPRFNEYYAQISGTEEEVDFIYNSHGERGRLLDVIRSGRDKDLIMGYSLHGIHKDELQMLLRGFPIKKEGSQGQNKTFLIALKFAQFSFLCEHARHEKPLLLLDDIFDKLDEHRVARIIDLVRRDSFGQIFITDTNREHLDRIVGSTDSDHSFFGIKQGNVTAL